MSSFIFLSFVSYFSSVGFKFPLWRPLFGFPSSSPCFFFSLVLILRTRVSFVSSPSSSPFSSGWFQVSYRAYSSRFPLIFTLFLFSSRTASQNSCHCLDLQFFFFILYLSPLIFTFLFFATSFVFPSLFQYFMPIIIISSTFFFYFSPFFFRY